MSYIGNKPATAFETVQKQISTSNSGTTITLDRAVTSVQDILLTIDAVVQSYDNYSVNGTTLTVGGTLNNNRVEILYVGRTMQSVDPTDDSVSSSKIKTDAVTTAKVQNDAITVDKLNLISTSSVPSLEAKGDGSSQDGYIALNCSQNSHAVKIKSPPHSANQSYTLTLPATAPASNKMLQTDGSGNLSFVDAPSGGLTFIKREVLGSNGDFDIDNLFTTDFANYLVVLEDFTCTVDSQGLRMRMHDTSGIVSGAKYRYGARYFQDDANLGSNTGQDQTYFQIATNSEEDATWLGYNATLTFYKPRQNTSTRFTGHGSFIQNDKTYLTASYLAGHIDDEQEMRGLFFYYSSGGIRAGATITSYGFNES